MIPPNYEVSRPEILADYSVPDRFTRTSHTHRKWEKGEMCHSVWVLGHDRLVYPHSRIVINVARLGKADHRMNQDVNLMLACRSYGQLAMSSVHGIASLEGDDFTPCQFLEVGSEL